MTLSREFMLARAAARDRRYDGVFLTCVRTTGIYCLPSCKARTPLPANVEHCVTPLEARARGFRACRRCRPDEFHAGRDPAHERLQTVLAAVRSRPGDFADAAAIASTLQVGVTKMAALFRQHLHASAGDTLLAARIAFACERLATSRARVLDIALDAGFASSSAFHDNFKRRTGTTPESYRRLLRADRFTLELPSAFPRAEFLRLWGRDAGGTCERLVDGVLHKAFALAGRPAVLSLAVRHGRAECRVEGAGTGPEAMRQAHATVVRMLDFAGDPEPGIAHLRREPALRPLLRARPGLRLLPAATPWECLAWAIVGQQVNVAFAAALRSAWIERLGERIGDLYVHPSPSAAAALDVGALRRLRFSGPKATHLLTAAAAAAGPSLPLDDLKHATATQAGRQLAAVRGIGPWTVGYVLLRGFQFVDALPVGDVVLAQALQQTLGLQERPDADGVVAATAPFAPYRGQLTMHLWNAAAER
ncbi:MAG: DNA-3-methyladenine glycosylase 2 family protein [Planctomycetes bacterium]|nr:DNA-3-methyladenine glycosylase 2 family protein [Planctomycetota bacterium]